MEWDMSFETGIPIVDRQHRALFRQVDALLDSSRTGRAGEMLDFLGEYVIEHFGTEEIMMKIAHYPDAAEHKEIHDVFTLSLGRLKAEYRESGNNMVIFMKITKAALDWLEYHIKGADKDFADYFQMSKYATMPRATELELV